jgi:protoporphyrinogen oxidase
MSNVPGGKTEEQSFEAGMVPIANRQGLNFVIGAGLTGLTAAYILSANDLEVSVLEAQDFIGGEARTVVYNDFRFDLGTHRFYTRNEEVRDLVSELLAHELLTVQRSTRICLQNRLVEYPINFFNALSALGPALAFAAATSYTNESIKSYFRSSTSESFEDWLISHFGRVLYEIYFKPYSEKAWGVSCKQLKADFAVQRIKGLSFREAVQNMLWRSKGSVSLERQFSYPRLGFGQIPDALANTLLPGSVKLQSPVKCVEHDGTRVTFVTFSHRGESKRCKCANIISTMPIDSLVRCMSPLPPREVLDAASLMKYRDQIFVFFMLDSERITSDHWIYFPGDDILFGRIHEPKNWSSAMSPPGKTSLVAEIFCFDSDPIWNISEEKLIEMVSHSLVELGLISSEQVIGACVVYLNKAYPLYVDDYELNLEIMFDFVNRFENLQVAGRDGMFKYTSGDYCIEMGIKAAKNIMGYDYNLREIASEQKYAEK